MTCHDFETFAEPRANAEPDFVKSVNKLLAFVCNVHLCLKRTDSHKNLPRTCLRALENARLQILFRLYFAEDCGRPTPTSVTRRFHSRWCGRERVSHLPFHEEDWRSSHLRCLGGTNGAFDGACFDHVPMSRDEAQKSSTRSTMSLLAGNAVANGATPSGRMSLALRTNLATKSVPPWQNGDATRCMMAPKVCMTLQPVPFMPWTSESRLQTDVGEAQLSVSKKLLLWEGPWIFHLHKKGVRSFSSLQL